MPAIGVTSGKRFADEDIENSILYIEMALEPLHREGDEEQLVFPVRRKASPHFRSVSGQQATRRVGMTEDDETHNKCIAALCGYLLDTTVEPPIRRGLAVSTRVFSEDGSSSIQNIYSTPPKYDIRWWREARIKFADWAYIQPDICVRDVETFMPGSRNRAVIIEVIQQHYPEQETFFKLLELSVQNHLVVFYFVPPSKMSSKFSRFDLSPTQLTLIPQYYMLDGEFYRNDKPLIKGATLDAALYISLEVEHFEPAMKNK